MDLNINLGCVWFNFGELITAESNLFNT